MAYAVTELRERQPQEAANDNRPPMREGDRWRMLIDGWKTISEPLALYAVRKKLEGWSFDEFYDHFMRYARADGWVD